MKITLSGEEAQRFEENEKQEADLSSAGSADGAERRHGERKSGAETRRSELRSGRTPPHYWHTSLAANADDNDTPASRPADPHLHACACLCVLPPTRADVSGGARPAQRHSRRR